MVIKVGISFGKNAKYFNFVKAKIAITPRNGQIELDFGEFSGAGFLYCSAFSL
jgi:hypothetical protein